MYKNVIKVGSLVRWSEFPDRLYVVKKKNMKHLGKDDYCELESIDHLWKSYVSESELKIDE